MVRVENFNPEDIVGKVLGPYKVLEYKGKTRDDKGNVYWYDAECIQCGYKLLTSRKNLQWINKASKMCKKCHASKMHELVNKDNYYIGRQIGAETMRCNNKPTRRNISTCIKHYQINAKRAHTQAGISVHYQHLVSVMVDGRRYRLLQKQLPTKSRDSEMVNLANKLNEVLHTGGKEAFLEWYKKGEWKQC